MIQQPPRPVLNASHPLAKGLLGAWPRINRDYALAAGAVHPSLTGRHHFVTRVATSRSRESSPMGPAVLTYTTTGVPDRTTTTLAGTGPAFPFSAFCIFRSTVGNIYPMGRWGGTYTNYDWVLLNVSSLVLYVKDPATGWWRTHNLGSSGSAGWRMVTICCESPTSIPYGALTNFTTNTTWQLPTPSTSGWSGGGGFASGVTEFASSHGNEGGGCATQDVRLWSRALRMPEVQQLHTNPWAMYRPPSRVLRGAVGAAGHAYYYRNFVTGAHR